MPQPLVEISSERITGERPRYTAEIVLVPGLWCTAAVWRRMMGFLAHRGWECTSLTFHPHPQSGWSEHQAALQAHLKTYSDAPIVIGHDAGGTLALGLEPGLRRAVVALAPLLPADQRSRDPLPRWTAAIAAWREQLVGPPSGRSRRAWFTEDVPGGARPESPSLIDDLRRLPRSALPTAGGNALLLTGADDPIVAPADVAAFATTVSADHLIPAAAGHALPWAQGWDKRVGEIHRWLIRVLGEALLLPPEEDD